MAKTHPAGTPANTEMVRKHYLMLGLNLAINLLIMYLVMFTMIWRFGDFFHNLNMLYMALMMWAPMAVLMLLMMRMMYTNQNLNMILYAVFALVTVLSFLGTRAQTIVGDRQFIRAMIPHHSGAILMCNRASIGDPALKDLCFKPNGIVESQEREIAEMTAILDRL